MNDYLKHLYAAFLLVDKAYYGNIALSLPNDEGLRVEYEQHIERVFSYELYYQFRRIMDGNITIYNGYLLNAEIRKNGFENTLVSTRWIFPDMVLHKSHTQNNSEGQLLFIEIKTAPTFDVENDIRKLITSVSSRLNYQNAVYVCINADSSNLKVSIKTYLNNKEIVQNPVLKDNPEILRKIWLLNENGYANFYDIKNL